VFGFRLITSTNEKSLKILHSCGYLSFFFLPFLRVGRYGEKNGLRIIWGIHRDAVDRQIPLIKKVNKQ
jgi:hypothetical protein